MAAELPGPEIRRKRTPDVRKVGASDHKDLYFLPLCRRLAFATRCFSFMVSIITGAKVGIAGMSLQKPAQWAQSICTRLERGP